LDGNNSPLKYKQNAMLLDEKTLTLHTEYSITSADTDLLSRIRVGSLVNLLIQSAIASAEKLGFGFGDLSQQQLFWVLRNLTVEIYRPILWGEKVVVETWPKDIDGILYLRDFVVRDSSGAVVSRATSGWLAVDMASKRPKRFSIDQMAFFTQLKDKHSLGYAPVKLAEVEVGEEFPIAPSFFDYDLNKHVTSTRYIDWMMDTLPLNFLMEKYPAKLSINYLKETLPGDTLLIGRSSKTEGVFEFHGTNQQAGIASFRGMLTYDF